MANELENFYGDFWHMMDDRQSKWNRVINKFGTAYEEAYDNHKSSLPAQTTSSDTPAIVGLIVSGTTAWLGWPKLGAVALVYIADAVNRGSQHLEKKPASVHITTPAIDMSPNKYKGSLDHFLNTPFIKMKEGINGFKEQARRERGTITADQIRTIVALAARSAMWHPPSDWDRWDNTDTIQNEFERLFWAAWAKNIQKTPNALGSYNYSKAVARLATLDNRTVDFQRLSPHYSDEENSDRVNLTHAIQIIKWAQSYAPITILAYPLPPAVAQAQLEPIMPFIRGANDVIQVIRRTFGDDG